MSSTENSLYLSTREAHIVWGWALVEAKNHFAVGNTLEVIHPSGNRQITIAQMQNEKGQAVEVAPGNPHRVWLDLQGQCDGALLAKLLD